MHTRAPDDVALCKTHEQRDKRRERSRVAAFILGTKHRHDVPYPVPMASLDGGPIVRLLFAYCSTKPMSAIVCTETIEFRTMLSERLFRPSRATSSMHTDDDNLIRRSSYARRGRTSSRSRDGVRMVEIVIAWSKSNIQYCIR